MNILAINHITINVKSLEKSKQFYRDVLQLKEAGFIDMGDHTLTYFQLTSECRLELIDYKTPVEEVSVTETNRGTYRHFCLETDDLSGFYDRCIAHNVMVRKTPSWEEKLSCQTMLIVDPNGAEIEIIQK